MSECVFIDDHIDNPTTSNADVKICFGEVYEWNKNWDGIRCKTWGELYEHIKEIEENG